MSSEAAIIDHTLPGRQCSADRGSLLRPRSAAVALGACLLVLIAGCSGSPGHQNSTADTEPADRSARPTATAESDLAADAIATDANASETPAADAPAADDWGPNADADNAPVVSQSTIDTQLQEDLIRSVIDNFNRLDEFDPSQVLPQLQARLNQWMWQSKQPSLWQRDPLISTLDPALSSTPLVAYALKNLDTGLFTINDMIGVQEAIWLRDVAKNARGSQLDDLSVAEQLFDWTVRNIQLVEEATPPVEHSASEILLLGRGTVRERAWIFLLLLREQGLDGVMLAIPGEDGAAPREWLTALVTDDDLFLFDPWLGMPLPGPPGHRIATLADVAADDELLRKLDVSSTRPYPVKAEQLSKLIAYVEASPGYLSRRMETLESRLTGDQRVILTAHPQRVAERLAARPQIGQVKYWPFPYEFLQTRGSRQPGQLPPSTAELVVFQAIPPLIKARILHFKGAVDGPRGAKHFYLESRLSNNELAHLRISPEDKAIWAIAKQNASYWLGLVNFEQKQYPIAVDFFSRRTLEATPDGPWTDGAHYNLGRTYEALGQFEPAIELFQSDRSPQKHGNRLRARRLKAQSQSATAEPADEKSP